MTPNLILPSEIPWSKIKGADLEELLYWLFDSMGAKDLEWRIGGTGRGAADQGRDLELAFFTPSPDGTLSKQNWWIEAKGRSGTVAASEVHNAVLNGAGKSHIEVLVVATNSSFSNPTRDWVREWQRNHPRPVIKLWERTQLENLCSKNPLAVIRLHGRALSPQGRVEVVSSRFWDYASLSDEPTLRSVWERRDEVAIDERALLALVASELANGDIGARSWALLVPDQTLLSALANGLLNMLYLVFRANDSGVRQEPLIRSISHLIIIATYRLNAATVSSLLSDVWNETNGPELPPRTREVVLQPVLSTLRVELQDVCASDCRRVSKDSELLQDAEIKAYWNRLHLSSGPPRAAEPILVIENLKKPCKVGFKVDKGVGCPLCRDDKPLSDIPGFIRMIDRVTRFRGEPDVPAVKPGD